MDSKLQYFTVTLSFSLLNMNLFVQRSIMNGGPFINPRAGLIAIGAIAMDFKKISIGFGQTPKVIAVGRPATDGQFSTQIKPQNGFSVLVIDVNTSQALPIQEPAD